MKKISREYGYILLIFSVVMCVQKIQAQSQLLVPVLSAYDKVFERQIELTIMVPESCIVYLTTNKMVPTRNDKRYHEGMILTFDSSVTLTAKAFRFFSEISDSSNVRWEDGGVVTATYTKILEEPQVQIAPVSADSMGVFMFSPDRSATIYYTLDGHDPDSFSNVYTDVFYVAYDAIVKAVVIKTGSITSKVITKSGPKVNVFKKSINNYKRIYDYKSDAVIALLNGKMAGNTLKTGNNGASALILRKNRSSIIKICGEN